VTLDDTHALTRRSWVASANGHADFPIQNLPFGVFATADNPSPRVGVAIGDDVLDLPAVSVAGLLDPLDAAMLRAGSLNTLMAADATVRARLRRRLSQMLTEDAPEQAALMPFMVAARKCTMRMPAQVGDYTDFYAGIHHALNVGRQFRPDQPLMPNYKFVPIGYHGRASSIVVSETPVRRPIGQRKGPNDALPTVGPSARLDFELELGVWIGQGNELGERIAIGDAWNHISGFCLLNDWSARDVQAWEYQPLGPFLAKSFATSISPWVVTAEALAPFTAPQEPRPDGDPAPLPYLFDTQDQAAGALDIELEVLLTTEQSRASALPAHVIARSNARHMYWTVAQLVTHHSSNGCNLRPGDLFGSGTISAPARDGVGSLLEMTEGGKTPLMLPWGEARTFLLDGDEVTFRGRARRDGYASIGFGEVRARVLPAR
jgi:fumarylacetoacetase